jgi:hypothetical protein
MKRAIRRRTKGKLTIVRRPPQFVLMAFDNCTELDRWSDWNKFVKQRKHKVRFTFFVSGTNFLSEHKRSIYQGPHHGPGEAIINFGGSVEDVRSRIDYVNGLYYKKNRKKGCEFGSHAVGHFHADDEHWDGADWASEFRSYGALLNNIAQNNGLPDNAGFGFSSTAIKGFRAPFLEVGRDLS